MACVGRWSYLGAFDYPCCCTLIKRTSEDRAAGLQFEGSGGYVWRWSDCLPCVYVEMVRVFCSTCGSNCKVRWQIRARRVPELLSSELCAIKNANTLPTSISFFHIRDISQCPRPLDRYSRSKEYNWIDSDLHADDLRARDVWPGGQSSWDGY